jgi:hypothetical protein
MNKNYIALLVVGLLFSACKNVEIPIVTFIEVPAIGQSSESNLHLTKNNDLLLSWIHTDSVSELQFSKLKEDDTWSQPNVITKGTEWFVNWADFPSVQSFGDSNLATYILDKSAEDTYAYDIKMQLSNDDGKTWNAPFKLHKDSTKTEHGFVSMDAMPNNRFLSVWLDGRNYGHHEKDSTIPKQMTLRSAEIDPNGNFINEHKIDNRVCDCCQTDVVSNGSEAIAVYRNRSDTEIRDIYFSKYSNAAWTTPKPVFNDGWKIHGCPVNGPRIDALGATAAVVWFTLNANNVPTIKHAVSTNFGDNFNTPVIITENAPLGRVDIKLLDAQTSVISWMETVEDKTVIYLQKIYVDGTKSEQIEVTETSENRSSGFPRLTIKDGDAYITWTDEVKPSQIKIARIDLGQVN